MQGNREVLAADVFDEIRPASEFPAISSTLPLMMWASGTTRTSWIARIHGDFCGNGDGKGG